MALALFGVGGGCSGSDRSSEDSSAESDGAGTADTADTEVLEGYVTAMASGDVDAAMELRCAESHISSSEHEAFEHQLGSFIEEEGHLGLERVEVDDTSPRVVSSLADRHAVLLRYWLSLDGSEVTEPLLAVVADDDGQRRLCSQMTAEFPEMYDELREGVTDLGAPGPVTLSELMPDSDEPGSRLVRDEAITVSGLIDPLAGASEGWIRMWQLDDGGATVAAYRYASLADARRAADGWLAGRDTSAIDAFEIPGIPGARGVRLLASAWLWVQPPTVGPRIDELTMVFGDTVVIAGVNSTAPDAHHERAIAQAEDVVTRARVPG